MTRFILSFKQAIDLVFHALENAENGDIFIQKTPACTIQDLATALCELFQADNGFTIIGTRHGEKRHETLLNREEMARCEETDFYYRILPDVRDLNYQKYFEEGETEISKLQDFNSENARRLNVQEIKEVLLTESCVQEELKRGINS
jgi:UDP-glucose 4-epimerase